MGLEKALAPARLAGLSLRNRVIKKTATFEGLCPGGIPSDDLVRHHGTIAAVGAAMTTVAYCGVPPDGLSFPLNPICTATLPTATAASPPCRRSAVGFVCGIPETVFVQS